MNSTTARAAITISDLVIKNLPDHLRDDLEDFRISYERDSGPTDLGRYYTTMRPYDEQMWLLEHHAKLYWDGLPAFLRCYMTQVIRELTRDGSLDDLPDLWLRAYQLGFLGRVA